MREDHHGYLPELLCFHSQLLSVSLVSGLFYCNFYISAKWPSSPEKKRAASKSPSPTFRAKKRKAGAESKEPTHKLIPRQQDFGIRDFIVRDNTLFTLRDF
jgi:hypothetical protein